MKDFECPVDNCDECEFQRIEKWCAQAIPIREELNDVYKSYMEGFWAGLDSAEEQYKWLVEHYDKRDDYIVMLEQMIEESNKSKTPITDENYKKMIDCWLD